MDQLPKSSGTAAAAVGVARYAAMPSILARFRRITTSGRFIPEIDGLRFIAIVLVFGFHLSGFLFAKVDAGLQTAWRLDRLRHVMGFGHHGVELFFVISGFILAQPFAAQYLKNTAPVSLSGYFLRRLTRLEPPYIVALTLLFFLRVVVGHESVAMLTPHLGAGFVYLHNLIYGNGNVINYVAWSLEIEIQFYVLVPVLARLFAIHVTWQRRTVIVAIITVAMILQWIYIAPETRLALTVLNFCQFFLFGFLLADIHVSNGPPQRLSYTWDLITAAGWPALLYVWEVPRLNHFVFAPLVFLLYCAMFRGHVSNWLIRRPMLTTIGGMCYTIYLLHFPVISAAGRLTVRVARGGPYGLNFLVQTLLIAPVVLFVSGIYFLVLERPCMRKQWPKELAQLVRGWWSGRAVQTLSDESRA